MPFDAYALLAVAGAVQLRAVTSAAHAARRAATDGGPVRSWAEGGGMAGQERAGDQDPRPLG